jgi:hypothetical protein
VTIDTLVQKRTKAASTIASDVDKIVAVAPPRKRYGTIIDEW